MLRSRSPMLWVTILAMVVWFSWPGETFGADPDTRATPDRTDNVGLHTSLELDSNGNPVVSYYDGTNGNLKLLHCVSPSCKSRGNSITSPDSAGDVGRDTSLELDSNGYPVVSYYDNTNLNLKVMHCNDANCSGGDESIESPDTGGNVGQYTSLELDSSGYPVVSYYDNSNFDLKVLHCNDVNCSGGDESITSPDTVGFVGEWTSLELDGSGYPVISYYNSAGDDLKVLHCNDANCSGGNESITSPDTVGGRYTSLELDGSGYPVVSYQDVINGDLKVLHCNDANCSGGNESIESPDGFVTTVGFPTSLELDGSGFPVVSYHDGTNGDLKVMHCNDANCSGGDESITSPDRANAVGFYPSLKLDSSGNPVVSYYHQSGGNLRVLHCDDPDCS